MEKTDRGYILLIQVLVMILCMTTITLAFLIDSNRKVNIFDIGENVSFITENFSPPEEIQAGDRVVKKVFVENENMNSFVRMYIALSDSNFNETFAMNINTADWKQEDDGYYYYRKPVAAGGRTTPIFDTLTFNEALPKNSGLKIICYGETVQAEGFGTAKAAFAAIKG
ncbi:MAG: hypothetical protein U0M21_06195 [Emergencia sp.]|nr:hypothetical protein [Emergencia sp.]